MDKAAVLSELGLSDGETKVYLALLKLGSVPVNELKIETKMHRTTIYDFIDKLQNKGLVSYVVKAGVNYYNATHPDRLMHLLKEKEDKLKEIMPDLNKLSEFHKEELKVEVYTGKEGYKTMLNLVQKTGKNLKAIGFEEKKYEEADPIMMRQHFKRIQEVGVHEYCIVSEETDFIYDKKTAPTSHYRFIPAKYFSPAAFETFGNYVAIQLWEPFAIILIESKPLAKAYSKYFDLLWSMATPYRSKKIKKNNRYPAF